ncbi:DUF5333 domain-containing protein [Rhodosalinus sp. K401]|uniref:DUF5333 domain-containing protein n=1 Tax=Rhodosalinus sp. K401 TaxID=3239195 RepID=UPI00352694A2
MRRPIAAALAAMLLAGTATASDARPPLREVEEIDGALLAVAIADEIRTRCDTIDARMLRALATLNRLENRARDLGYTKSEIDAYVNSKDEKARIRALGERYVRQQGADPESLADICDLGRREIARGSAIGALLRKK